VDDPEPTDGRGEEGRFAANWQNKAAGRALRAVRLAAAPDGATQADFAATLSQELGVPISPTTLSGWETGRRAVPATVWIAAAVASNQSLDAVLGETGAPAVVGWAERMGLTGRLEGQAAEIDALRTELDGIRGELAESGAMLARCIAALEGAGLLGDVAGDEAHRSDRRAAGTDT
jgi:hypothetical protein